MKRSIFEGSAAAVVTPMDEYGNLDLDAMGRLLDWLLEEKTDAIVVNGTTGESATLDDNEKMEVIGFVIRHVNGRVPVIAGTGSNCTEHAVKLSREAEKLGADALLQVTPYYNKASQEGLVRHFTQVGDHVGIPMILYNVPSRTGVTIQPETYRILSEHPNIRGAKEAGGNMSMIAKTAALCGDGFDIYSGNDDHTIPIMALGGKGVISVLANIMPRQTHDMCRLFLEGKLEESRKMQLYLLDIMEALFWDVNPIPVKAALSIMGMCMDSCRLPLTPMKAGEKAKLEAVMKRYR
ncbi:MAG: 4-hydroxy-tetrahydrodipicolinate synthase [Clostridium sp.]|uniref:4-hydroxy-tetrahydrodipicolinate synthase n=1 Tax=Enterocloster citroniae TaxID=358743 RepID=UPI00349E54E5|nr:4-hydroxy-tetrahydrodipicolinate synthase [Clostridium sp.]